MRRRFKQTESLQNRLAQFAKQALAEAAKLPPEPEQDELMKKARTADTAVHIDEWASYSGLQPPK